MKRSETSLLHAIFSSYYDGSNKKFEKCFARIESILKLMTAMRAAVDPQGLYSNEDVLRQDQPPSC